MLHPLFAKALETAALAKRPGLSEGSVADARALVDNISAFGPGPDIADIRDISIPTRAGHIPARLYKPAENPPGILVYFHGGGWVTGSISGYDALARALADRSGCTVVLVDYRLAPEARFPGPLQDAEDAMRWVDSQRTVLARPLARLALGGDSAGANLATVAALSLKDEIDIALQLLWYPVTDSDQGTPSYERHATGLSLTRRDMRWFLEHYADPSEWTDPRIAPNRADLRGAPAAWLALAEYDVLLSEGQTYAERLRHAGTEVHVAVVPGMAHGFARWFNLVEAADQSVTDAARAVSQSLARPLADKKENN